jgi:glutamate-1-semialdehyde 2,1-aminomutase
MQWAATTLAVCGLGAAALATSMLTLGRRLELSQAKHRSLAGHARMARRLAGFVPFYDYGEERFFASDSAPADIASLRRAGFARLSGLYKTRFAETIRCGTEAAETISDLQFTGAYRAPFQYRRMVRTHLPLGAFLQSSEGVTVTDLDGNRFYDLTGSYGVNVFGYDFYKGTIERGAARVHELGPVLGAYHPLIIENTRHIKEISGLDEVSFHMSGTEAVMQAVRLARYHTRRSHLVRFCGAYHGWWGDVQPGIGNPQPAHETYTLAEMSEDTLHVLRTRRDIACVLVNPEQGLHPNAPAPTDSSLLDSTRSSHFDKAQAPAAGVQRAQHRADLRRGVRRLSPGAGRRARVFRRPRRPRHLWQDDWRWAAHWRCLRPEGFDEAVPRRPPRRHLLRPRHVQRASLRDGGDERFFAPVPDRGGAGALS